MIKKLEIFEQQKVLVGTVIHQESKYKIIAEEFPDMHRALSIIIRDGIFVRAYHSAPPIEITSTSTDSDFLDKLKLYLEICYKMTCKLTTSQSFPIDSSYIRKLEFLNKVAARRFLRNSNTPSMALKSDTRIINVWMNGFKATSASQQEPLVGCIVYKRAPGKSTNKLTRGINYVE